jgi:hypothetical protein
MNPDEIEIKIRPQDMVREKMLIIFGVDLRELGMNQETITSICEQFLADCRKINKSATE